MGMLHPARKSNKPAKFGRLADPVNPSRLAD